jgi:hypothetical protein
MAKLEPLQTLRCDISEKSVQDAEKAAAAYREDKKAGLTQRPLQQSTLAQLAKLRQKKGTDLGVFARNHRLSVTLDEDGEPVSIPGTNGEIVRRPSYGLSLNYQGRYDEWLPRLRELYQTGSVLISAEHTNIDPQISGCVSFDPQDENQVDLILRHGGIERIKRGTPESRAAAGERLKALHEARRAAPKAPSSEKVGELVSA